MCACGDVERMSTELPDPPGSSAEESRSALSRRTFDAASAVTGVTAIVGPAAAGSAFSSDAAEGSGGRVSLAVKMVLIP